MELWGENSGRNRRDNFSLAGRIVQPGGTGYPLHPYLWYDIIVHYSKYEISGIMNVLGYLYMHRFISNHAIIASGKYEIKLKKPKDVFFFMVERVRWNLIEIKGENLHF